MHRLPILIALAACHASPRAAVAIHAELVYSASQGYGLQPTGEDKAVVYAFVHIDAPAPSVTSVTELRLERGGDPCAHPTKPLKIDRVDAFTKATATHGLTLEALAHGTRFDGNLTAGANYLRIEVEVDHACGGHDTMPDLAIRLDDGEKLVAAVDESMPT
ncbi:MAG TPA: hypothetical protein VGO00_20260 [Kofleriaceae bacterium]|jgi:hypothetical protein|nr:hypothetical protein [Kofleriaceae bacterium]